MAKTNTHPMDTLIKEATNQYVVAMMTLLGSGKSGEVEAELTLNDNTQVKVTFAARAPKIAEAKKPVKKATKKVVKKTSTPKGFTPRATKKTTKK